MALTFLKLHFENATSASDRAETRARLVDAVEIDTEEEVEPPTIAADLGALASLCLRFELPREAARVRRWMGEEA